jgi:ABC-type polysaccharide/polyol phosphate transport system ATPase subunit
LSDHASAPLIVARGISKYYPAPRHPIARLVAALRGNSAGDPWHWVLKDIDFQIGPAESVGFLGRNGAGKTTLLSILAGITNPSSGEVVRRGRIVPLLELGGGLDLHRTGRANVITFGATYGVSQREMSQRLAAVEEFADIGEYFDQPLRVYSSGMRSRLAFAAAMSLSADLVILDETLTVGDLSFRMKCYDALRARQAQGTAFLLVSHNPDTLANLCGRIAVLHEGRLVHDGEPVQAVMRYKAIRLDHAEALDSNGVEIKLAEPAAGEISCGYGEQLNLSLAIISPMRVERPILNLGILDRSGRTVSAISSRDLSALPPIQEGCALPVELRFVNRLAPGKYQLIGSLRDGLQEGPNLSFNRAIATLRSTGDQKIEGTMKLDLQANGCSTSSDRPNPGPRDALRHGPEPRRLPSQPQRTC